MFRGYSNVRFTSKYIKSNICIFAEDNFTACNIAEIN